MLCSTVDEYIYIYTYMYTDGADHSGLNSYLLNMMKIYKCLVNCTYVMCFCNKNIHTRIYSNPTELFQCTYHTVKL